MSKSKLIDKEVKQRQRIKPSEEKKTLKKVRDNSPIHVIEVELLVEERFDWKLQRIQEHLRQIRNTILGEVMKNYIQMKRTKKYKRTMKNYISTVKHIGKEKDKKQLALLEKDKKELKKQFEELRDEFNITFEFVRKYGEYLKGNIFTLPDAVTTLSVCENVWTSFENILYGTSEKPYFYKKDDVVTLQGKQAERCIILKHNQKRNSFCIHFNGLNLPLKVKKNDLFINETLSNIIYYKNNSENIDRVNVERHNQGLNVLPTYRIKNNRIVRKNIRGKNRYYVQIVLEGKPVQKRNKDGSFRHSKGTGRITCDIGTQSVAIVSKEEVILKNLAERSENSFVHEHKIHLLQRYLDRSRRAMNPNNFNENGTVKRGRREWIVSKRYLLAKQRIKNLHRKAAESRKYAHNEDINYLRSLGDECLIENMNIKALQLRAKEVTINEKTGRYNRRKRYGESIRKRSPGYFIEQIKYRFKISGGKVDEVNTWTFKASQYDHVLDDVNKKQLSKRWHVLPNGIKLQRDLYSAFLLYCSNDDLQTPSQNLCLEFFDKFHKMHDICVQNIKDHRKMVLNSGIKIL